uniref:Peptidase_M28 domain-containing protein n=1 Tax=Caenorhabditis japonica TaxID=281687 RepID=A0A8R1E2Q3_CAEJA
MHWITVPLTLCLIAPTMSLPATMADMDRMRHDLSKFLSIPRSNETEKSVARAAIKRALEAVGLSSMTHTFIHEESNEIGANVIAVQKGPYFGTGNDKLVIMSANYDTLEGSPGVDDNGSGVAAVLEAARVLSTLDTLYPRQHTIVYAFFDMKHKALAGSHAFVEDILLPLMDRTSTKVIGAVIADGLLHFDPFPASQAMPTDFESFFPDAAQQLHEHSHMGDFIQISSRIGVDEDLVKAFARAYNHSSEMLSTEWQFHPWHLHLQMDITSIQSLDRLYKLHPFLFSDHSSFFFHSKQSDVQIPTIYLTDTLNLRGVRQYCAQCDGLYMMTEQNMKFLALMTDSLIRFLIEMSESAAMSVVDDLYAMLMNYDVRH